VSWWDEEIRRNLWSRLARGRREKSGKHVGRKEGVEMCTGV